jgi:hypothetical protein
VRLGQGLVSQNPWRALTSASLFFSASGALVHSTRVTKPLSGVHPLTLPTPFYPTPPSLPPRRSSSPHPRNPRFLTGSSPPPRGSFSRSSSVPTRRLGLRPITCLPVIRCCANPSPLAPLRLASQFPLCSRRRKTWRISGREFAIITSRTNRDYYFVVRNPPVEGSSRGAQSSRCVPRESQGHKMAIISDE